MTLCDITKQKLAVPATSPLSRKATTCIAEIQATPPPGCFYWLSSSPQRMDSAMNRSRQVTVTWWWKASAPVPHSHRQRSLQPSTKKRQQTLPGSQQQSRGIILLLCSESGMLLPAAIFSRFRKIFLLLSIPVASNCHFRLCSSVYTVSLLLSNMTWLPKQIKREKKLPRTVRPQFNNMS